MERRCDKLESREIGVRAGGSKDERGCEDCTIKMMNGWLVLFEAKAERETRMRNEKNRILFVISVMTRIQGNFDAINEVICLLPQVKY